MRQSLSSSELERFVDGQCTPEETPRVARALAGDPALAARAHELTRLSESIREHGTRLQAPQSLRESVDERFTLLPRNGMPMRRRVLIGGGAAVAASLAMLTLSRVTQLDSQQSLTLDEAANTFFKDFDTWLLKDRSDDFAADNPVQLAGWYQERLPFELPRLAAEAAGAHLTGGRLCWLLERRLASLSYRSAEGPLVLYITEAPDIEPQTASTGPGGDPQLRPFRQDTRHSVLWKSGGLLMALVGTPSLPSLTRIANAVLAST